MIFIVGMPNKIRPLFLLCWRGQSEAQQRLGEDPYGSAFDGFSNLQPVSRWVKALPQRPQAPARRLLHSKTAARDSLRRPESAQSPHVCMAQSPSHRP